MYFFIIERQLCDATYYYIIIIILYIFYCIFYFILLYNDNFIKMSWENILLK